MIRNQISYLGNQLIKLGKITSEELHEALLEQKKLEEGGNKGRLGQILVDMGFCSQEDIAFAMAEKSGSSFYNLSTCAVDLSAMSLISPEMSQRYQALAIGFEDDKLLVAMMNPNDLIAIDDLRILTGYEISPVVVSDKELISAIRKYTRDSSDIEQEDNFDDIDMIENGEEDDKPAVLLANQIFSMAVSSGVSDVHIEPQEKHTRVRFRIDGVMHEVMQQHTKIHAPLVSRIKVLANMDIAERRIPQDGRITLRIEGKVVDIRAASLPSAYGEKLTLRILDRSDKLFTLSELGFPESQLQKYNETIRRPYGFILITGPTGSGKSTTLYATLAKLNSVDKNIITLEDPIERRMDGVNQIQMNEKAGMTFASGLRAILRNDPDIIMVGEIRDFETAKIAVESALTGHLVISTLHTNDAASAITRLSDMGVERYLTSSALVGVVGQRLMRILCPNCKRAYKLSREEILSSIPDFPIDEDENEVELFHARGCIACNRTGYKGRIGIYEFLPVDEYLQRLIITNASVGEIRDYAIEKGMITMRSDGLMKVKNGISSVEELLRVTK